MKQKLGDITREPVKQNESPDIPQPAIDKIADKVMTAVVATTIVQSGRGVAGALAKNPWLMFGLGLATGYLAHKYRKEIIILSAHTAEHSQDFLHRQKQGLQKWLNAENSPQKSGQADSIGLSGPERKVIFNEVTLRNDG